MNDLAKNIILWIVIAIVLLSVFNNFATGPRVASVIEYSQFLDYVDTGMVDDVRFDGRETHIITPSRRRARARHDDPFSLSSSSTRLSRHATPS